MAKRGRKPTPTSVLKSRGSWRAKNHPDEPEVQSVLLEPPKRLTADEKKVWKEIAKELHAIEVTAKSDAHELELLCDVWVRWLQTRELLNEDPLNRTIINHYHKLVGMLDKLLSQFGMTPSSRTQVKKLVGEKDKKKNGKPEIRIA